MRIPLLARRGKLRVAPMVAESRCDEHGEILLVAPSVGYWRPTVSVAAAVIAGEQIGVLSVLGQVIPVHAPTRERTKAARSTDALALGWLIRGTSARQSHASRPDKSESAMSLRDGVPVAYGDVLLRLTPRISAQETGASRHGDFGEPSSLATASDSAPATESHLWPFAAPLGGRFFAATSPDAPSLVRTGQQISKGETLGLIEVMKTFHHLVYEGDSLPDQAVVEEVCVEDGADIAKGASIFILRAL